LCTPLYYECCVDCCMHVTSLPCANEVCIGCIAQCEMQAATRQGERGIAVELVTLFTQTIWHVTPLKYTNNCHCTCKVCYYYPVGANKAL